ncbi:MAG: electron transport complex subunit RsxD [Pseudomonadota bacterium]
MKVLNVSSPHLNQARSLPMLMLWVVIAGVPGMLTMMYYFGWGVLINVIIACSFALLTEVAILKWRQKPIRRIITDNTALVTAFLYALCLPALLPWWATALGIIFAIAVVKQLYGGVGNNIFNPAMAGYVLLLVSFPVAMTTHWVLPTGLVESPPSFMAALSVIFTGAFPDGAKVNDLVNTLDAVTGATPLDSVKTALTQNFLIEEVMEAPVFGQHGGLGWEWINFTFFLGGLLMIFLKVCDWRIPLAMIIALFIVSSLFYTIDSQNYAHPMFNIVTGGTMLGAFFIATDPVTASTTPKGRWIYGAMIGILIYIIRTWSSYPDGVAFAVLLMNMTVPTLDHYTKPRTYGHTAQGA